MPVAGHATPEGTGRYRDRMADRSAAGHFRAVGRDWWSSIGIGTYLGRPDDRTDERVRSAVVAAVRGGVNVIDCAINYRFQRGERSVGRALSDLLDGGEIGRDEVIVCTKGGFLPDPGRRAWFEAEYGGAGPDGPALDDLIGDVHCMHPAYLSDQLDRSRANLGLETIDVYYVHNPETQLRSVDRDTFDIRLLDAFRMLETAVAGGRIRSYGLATWAALRVAPDHADHLSLARVKALARQAAGAEDHFRFIQLPLNLGMREAIETPTQRVAGKTLAAVPAARLLGLHPVASGAIAEARIRNFPGALTERLGRGLASDAQRALQYTRSAPGITSALVGMKDPAHVGENVALVAEPPLDARAFPRIAAE